MHVPPPLSPPSPLPLSFPLLFIFILSYLSGTHNQNIQVYNNTSLTHVATLTGHIGSVTVLKVTESQAGVYMFSGSSDYSVQVGNALNYPSIL